MKDDPIKAMIEKVYEMGYKTEMDRFASDCVELGIQYGIYGRKSILGGICIGIAGGLIGVIVGEYVVNKLIPDE